MPPLPRVRAPNAGQDAGRSGSSGFVGGLGRAGRLLAARWESEDRGVGRLDRRPGLDEAGLAVGRPLRSREPAILASDRLLRFRVPTLALADAVRHPVTPVSTAGPPPSEISGYYPAPLQGSKSTSSGSCGGRSLSGTLRRFTRILVHVVERPRMLSTSTSAGARYDQTSA